LLEGAFGDAEFLVNFRGGAFVGERPEAAAGDELPHNLFFEIIDALAARWVEGEVDLAVVAEGGDVAGKFLAVGEFLEDLVGEEQAGVGAVDDGLVAHRGFPIDGEFHLLAVLEIGGCEIDVTGDAGGGDDAAAFLID
jgi:hypothetical protein